MNQVALVKRAFAITRRYRVLWLFGILIALTAGGSGGGNVPNFSSGGQDLRQWGINLPPELANFDPSRYIGWFVLCCGLLLILGIAAAIVRYVASTALYRAVDQIEATGVAPTWREGFRLGWNRRAFRIFVLNLIVGVALLLAMAIMFGVGFSPLLLLLTGSDVAKGIGIALTVILVLLAIITIIIAGIALSVLGEFWAREIALRDRSIGEALTSGYALVRGRLKDVGVMWLLMAGIYIGFSIVLLPVVLALMAIGGGLGFAVGYGVYAATNAILPAVLCGLPIFMLIVGVPLTFISGLYVTFTSSAWTLTYREVAA